MALHRVKVAKITQEADGIRSFLLAQKGLFKLPAYAPGAHIDVHCGEGIIRQYSLCGDPTDRRHYLIAVKQGEPSRGGSDLMHGTVQEGDVLEIGRPRNSFELDEGPAHSVLLAAGIGITPIIAMADRLAAQKQSFELHYFSRSAEQAAFRDRLENGTYRDRVTFNAGLSVEETDRFLYRILWEANADSHVYMCGPGPFMDTAEVHALKTRPAVAVHFERFAANPALSGALTKAFTVTLARTGITLPVGADETILDVLDANGIDAAFSCEQGVCGTCVSDVVDGTPDHCDSFLSEKQKSSGDRMCICVSRARGDTITIDI
jgi:vanillate O-demethylase ferredoxin subunit